MKRVQVGVVSTCATRPYMTAGEGRGEELSKSNRNKLAEKLPALDPAFLHLGSSRGGGGGGGGGGDQQQADFIYELAIFLPNLSFLRRRHVTVLNRLGRKQDFVPQT